MSAVYLIGDIHGHFDRLIALLKDEARLIDDDLAWCGGNVTLCLLGDYFDRGDDGIGTIDLVMRIQAEAQQAGGKVIALLGNHEPFILAAYHFGEQNGKDGRREGIYVDEWRAAGGIEPDLERLTWQHVQWLSNLPAMAKIRDRLVIHADALFYVAYGRTVAQVNQAICEVLHSRDTYTWDTLLNRFIFRRAFLGEQGAAAAKEFLQIYGGRQIIHGHTPIRYMTGQPAVTVRGPYIYANDLCVNIDPGLFLGGLGFVYRLEDNA